MESKGNDGPTAGFLSEIASLKHDLESARSTRRGIDEHVTKLSQDLDVISSDRDALVAALEGVESILVQVNHKIDSVTTERDNITNLYNQVCRQLSDNNKSTPIRLPASIPLSAIQTQTPAIQTQTLHAELNGGTDIAKQFKVLHEERDRLAESNENLNAEIKMMRADVVGGMSSGPTGNSDAYHTLESERDGLKISLEACERDKSLLEDNYTALEKHVGRLKEDISNMERSEDRLKTGVRQLEMERDKEVFGMRQIKARLNEADVTLERLNKELDRVKKDNGGLGDQVKQQRSLLESIDHERDLFQCQMDQKDVEVDGLTERCIKAESERKGVEEELMIVRDTVEGMRGHLNGIEVDLANVQASLHAAVMERDQYAMEAEVCL
jgi:chromosome segregation ATPase